MEYRKLRKEETQELNKLQANVYFFNYDENKPVISKEIDEIRWKSARGVYFEDNILAAMLETIPFDAYLDGNRIFSPGVAGVATLPEYRRRGAVKMLLCRTYEEMKNDGAVMSYLYPFSHEFYYKYGYAQGSSSQKIKIDIDKLDDFKHEGFTKQYYPEKGYEDIKEIYDCFSKKYNCCVAREDWRWKCLFSAEPHKSDDRVLIRYDKEGSPAAYLKFKAATVESYVKDMEIMEAAWKGTKGIHGLISLIKAYEGDLRKVIIDVPDDFPAELITKDHWSLNITKRHTGMSRIIDAQKALENIKKPCEPGNAVISIKDEFAPWNQANWKVEWEKGQCNVSKTSKEPDMQCEAPEFSQLVTGYFPLETIKIRNNVSVYKNKKTLSKLFVKKPCFIWDRF